MKRSITPKLRIFVFALSLAIITFSSSTGFCEGSPFIGVPGVGGGVVTTSEPNAARVGAEILKSGGNAIDAAAAVQFALNVVEPQSSGIGGGGFMVIYLAKQRKTVTVDSREKAPDTAVPDMFVPFSGNFGVASTCGLAVGVPGTLLGVATALEKWGHHRPERGAGSGDRTGSEWLSRRPPAGGKH